jgi:hypothetical protein
MLQRVALVRTDVSEKLSTSIIRVTRIGELGTTLVQALSSSETSVLTIATRRNIPEEAILHVTVCLTFRGILQNEALYSTTKVLLAQQLCSFG